MAVSSAPAVLRLRQILPEWKIVLVTRKRLRIQKIPKGRKLEILKRKNLRKKEQRIR